MDPARLPGPRAIALQGLKVLLGYADAGVHEVGGNNRGDQVEFFQHMTGNGPGDPWCASCVSTCEVKGAAQLMTLVEDRGALLHYYGVVRRAMPLGGYCPAIWQDAVHMGMWRPPSFSPSPGDYVLFLTGVSRVEPHHIEVVRPKDTSRPQDLHMPEGTLFTAGGNTTGGPGVHADGDGVFRRTHGREAVFGFVHFG